MERCVLESRRDRLAISVLQTCRSANSPKLSGGLLEAPPASDSSGDGFVLYDCEDCDYLRAFRVGEEPGEPHACGADASGDSDRDSERDSTTSILESESVSG